MELHTYMKLRTLITLCHSADLLVSEVKDKEKELIHVQESLRANGYNKWIMK